MSTNSLIYGSDGHCMHPGNEDRTSLDDGTLNLCDCCQKAQTPEDPASRVKRTCLRGTYTTMCNRCLNRLKEIAQSYNKSQALKS